MKKTFATFFICLLMPGLNACSKNTAELTEEALENLVEVKENADSPQELLEGLEEAVEKLEKAEEIATKNPRQAAKDMANLSESGRLGELKRAVMDAEPKKRLYPTSEEERRAQKLIFQLMGAMFRLEKYAP